MLATGSVPLFDNVDLTSKRQPPSCHRVGNAKPSHQPISHDPSFNQPGRSTLVRAVAKSSARGCAHLASTHAWRALELAGLARLWEFPQPFAVATPPATPATPTQQLPASVMPYACRHCAEVPQGRGARAVQLRRRLMYVAFKTTPNVDARPDLRPWTSRSAQDVYAEMHGTSKGAWIKTPRLSRSLRARVVAVRCIAPAMDQTLAVTDGDALRAGTPPHDQL